MDKESIEGLIKQALETTTSTKLDCLPDCDFVEAGILDSLDSMVFLIELENIFNVDFPSDTDPREAGWLETKKLIKYIKDRLKDEDS